MNERKKILVVDDEEAIVNALVFRLEAAGYDTVAAYNGVQALEAASKEAPDLVLLDRRLPDLDGMEVLAALRRHGTTKSSPVVLLSGADTDRERALAEGADAVLKKPYQGAELLDLVGSLTSQRPPC